MIRIEAASPITQRFFCSKERRLRTRQVAHYTRVKIDGRQFKHGAVVTKKRGRWAAFTDALFGRTQQ